MIVEGVVGVVEGEVRAREGDVRGGRATHEHIGNAQVGVAVRL